MIKICQINLYLYLLLPISVYRLADWRHLTFSRIQYLNKYIVVIYRFIQQVIKYMGQSHISQ